MSNFFGEKKKMSVPATVCRKVSTLMRLAFHGSQPAFPALKGQQEGSQPPLIVLSILLAFQIDYNVACTGGIDQFSL